MTPSPDCILASMERERAMPASSRSLARPDAPAAQTLLWQAALLGLSGDALIYNGPVGPGVALWVFVIGLAALSLTWSAGRRVPREAAAWLAMAVLLAACTAWRDAEALRLLDVLATLVVLALAAVALRDPGLALAAPRLRDTLWAGLAIVRSTARGIVPLALRELFAADRRAGGLGRARTTVRLGLIAGTLLLVFGSLLRSADPIFASIVSMPEFDIGTLMSHLVVTAFCAWIAGGWAYGALVESPTVGRAPERLPVTLGVLDLTTALGTLNVLFGAYVLTQLGWFFGGERFLHATTGLTAAQYARQGFFQMAWVVALVVPLLLTTRAVLGADASLARRHTLLSLPIVALLGAIITSAALRMRLYVHYYGLTTERLYTLVFMGWLAIVLILLAATVLRGRGRTFVAGGVISALTLLLGLHLVVPDVVVARVNLARATSSDAATPLDLAYLARLSGDAVPLAVDATLAPPSARDQRNPFDADARCAAASRLLYDWGPASRAVEQRQVQGAWRTWNAGESRALRAVGARSAELRRLRHATCTSGWESRAYGRSGYRFDD
ncbi:MAG TPA: DUF4173 domain-containing protein [Gemmatimonadaceae bacterium]|nr:DUF4173 domain-containing protein [Gemmatimonadaceae bacterium]